MSEKSIYYLTSDTVSILTQTTDELSEEVRNHMVGYDNSESGRADLIAFEPDEVVNKVMEVWGDTPTVETPVVEPTESELTTEERIASLEEQNEMLTACILEMSEIVYGG